MSCPICGKGSGWIGHRCKQKALDRIERQHARASDDEDDGDDRDETERLYDGLRAMEDDPWGDDGFDPHVRPARN